MLRKYKISIISGDGRRYEETIQVPDVNTAWQYVANHLKHLTRNNWCIPGGVTTTAIPSACNVTITDITSEKSNEKYIPNRNDYVLFKIKYSECNLVPEGLPGELYFPRPYRMEDVYDYFNEYFAPRFYDRFKPLVGNNKVFMLYVTNTETNHTGQFNIVPVLKDPVLIPPVTFKEDENNE